jgi:hypothetical protein
MSIEIDTITFNPQGLVITYMDAGDVRVDGKVIVAHQIQLHNSHPDYRADAQRLAELAQSVVANALEDWANTPAHTEDDDNDDDRGMGE